MQHLTSITTLAKNDILNLIYSAQNIKLNPFNYKDRITGKIIAALFFEPSTRTRLSFESAALRLGARVLGFADANTTSTKKGETLEDTIKIISGFADCIVMRHPETGASARAASVSTVPIINAGDGSGEHPTQALLDIFTIFEKKPEKFADTADVIARSVVATKQSNASCADQPSKKLDFNKSLVQVSNLNQQFGSNQCASLSEGLKIAFVGDLKFGRTVHSLSQGLAHFNPTFYFISPPSLKMPREITDQLLQKGVASYELETWETIADKVDVLYMTRVQAERFADTAEYEQLKLRYVLNKETAALFRKNCLFMHPLPRVGEIDTEIDADSRAIYFKEAWNGVWMRMAILLKLV